MDIMRIVAVFSVISVHFLLYNGFYSQTVEGGAMYIMCLMRTLFSVCVPLFIILTGYLMSQKTLSKKYYFGLSKTLVIYVLASIACVLYKVLYKAEEIGFKDFIFGILDFSDANYSWYIEMYIGLFLFIPFLNIMYNKLASKRHKQILVFTMIVLTILPSLFNVFNFETLDWWSNPPSSDTYYKLIPSYWTSMYPLAYYFTGAYIREYGIKARTRTLCGLFAVSLVVFGSFNFYRSYGSNFSSGAYVNWRGFEPYILSTLLFVIISRLNANKLPGKCRYALMKVSDCALGIYLVSYIFDNYLYEKLNEKITVVTDRLPYYFVIVPLVFIGALILSAVLNVIQKYLFVLCRKISAFVKENKNKFTFKDIQDIAFVFLFAGAMIFAFWKTSYGFGGNDEPFYLTVAHRLSLGDALFKDEWHLSQLSGFLLWPFVSIYRLLTQSTEGILMAARILYVIFHAFVSLVVYIKIRKHGPLAACAALLYFIFTPFDIMALSYNTMGLDLVVLTGILLGTADYKKKIPLIISGLIFAGAVLCCPYLAFAYVIYIICVIVHYIMLKNNRVKNMFATEMFSGKTFLLFTLGVGILAVIFLICVLPKVSVSEILTNLPYMLDDPEHPQISFFSKIQKYFNSIYTCYNNFKISVICYGITLLAMIIDRKRKNHRSIYLIASTAIAIFSFMLFLPNITSSTYNAVMFPMIFVGITSYILCDKKPKTLFGSLFMLGILYSLALCFSSNQYFYVISMAVSASNIASLVFLSVLLKEMRERPDEIQYSKALKRIGVTAAACTVLLQGGMQIGAKAYHCFWDGSPEELTTQITVGPAKGIYTTAENAYTYKQIYADLQAYTLKDPDNVLILSYKTWCYLALDNYPYGTYSAWLSGENEGSIERLETYYALNPEKIPTYIYIPKDSEWDLTNLEADAAEKGYSVNETEVGYMLEKE